MDITENPEGFFSNLSSIANDEKPKEEKIEKPEEPKTSNASIIEDPESFFSNLSKTPEQKSQEETGGDFFKTAYKTIDEFLVQPKAQQEPTPDQSFLTSIQKKKTSDLDKFDVDYIKSLTPDQRYSVMQARKDIPLDILSDDEQRQLHENEKSKGILSFPKEKGFWYNLLDGYNEMAQGAFDIGKTAAKVAVGSAEVPYRILQGASGDYGAALEGEKLLSPEDKKEVEAWRVNAINLANTPMSSGDPRQKDIYLDSKYLAKILEKLTPEQRQQVKETEAKKIADAKSSFYSFFAPAFELPGAVANAGKTILAGGIGIGDWGNEKMAAALGPEMEQKAKELSFANWKARRKIKQAHEAYTREFPDVYARMYENPALKSALNEITLFQGPSVEETAKSRGISEDAAKELLKKEAEKNNEVALKELEQQLPEVSESAKLTGEFLLPRGIGMELFGAAGLATEATKNVARGLKFLNKTEDEINAIMEADRALQRSRTAQRYAARQEIGKDVSRAGEKMEEIGQKFRPISEFIEKKTSNLSKIALPVTGVVYGYQHDPEHPILGSLKYGLGGLGLKYAKEIPAFTKELGEAIRVSAPGTTFETLGKVPEGSKIKEKILANGGKGIDNLLANAKEYAQTGIHGGALGLAVGLSSEDDPEIIKKMASDGLLYSVGTRGIQHVLGKFSVDPVIEERNRKIDDYKIYQEYKNSTPETQKNIDDLTDWNNVVQAYEGKANEYKDELNDAIQTGDQAKIEKAQSNVDALDSSIKNLKKANLQTRNELGRQFLKSYVAANELANSALLPGQNNVGFHILTTNEIFQKLRSDPANANVPDADIAKTAAQQGFYSGIGTAEHVPGAPITPGETGMTFDRTKNSIVLNADALRDRMVKYRQTPIDALWHELSHYLFKIPEFRKLMENVESSLFSTEVKDISGKVIASTSGIYSPKDLVDMYRKSYMQGHDVPSIESLAKLSGVWDESRGTLDEQKVANYMREEVMADLFGEAGQRHIASTMDGGKRSIIENAIVKTKQLILDKALARFRGLGGKGDVVRAANSGAEFSPEVMKAAKKALDAMRDLNGAISPAIEATAKPLISKAQMAKSKAIAGRYGMDSGLFETKMTASVFDADGNKIGESMPVSDLAFEGAFQSTPQGLKQLSGYGSLPNELAGVNIPEGGKIVVGKEFVMSPDGKTPIMLKSADVKKAVKGRSNLIRTELAKHDDGSPTTFRAVSDDGLTFRGTFNPEQIKAIQELPESIVPRSIKENILKANESIAAADGTRWIMDYAAMMDDYGNYKAFAPKLYDFVPIGMHFSKEGNFLITSINVGRIFQKMRLWNERMPGKLKMWDNNLEMAFDDFANIYLQNWKNGRPGETGLDKNPTIALAKKGVFADLLNIAKEQYNPDRSVIPKRKGDPKGKNLDNVMIGIRVDHIAEMIKNEEATKLPVNYGFAKINFMPERMEGEAPIRKDWDEMLNKSLKMSYDEFVSLAKKGKIIQATGEKNPFVAGTGETPLSYGAGAGYSLPDIVHFYSWRTAPMEAAYNNFLDNAEFEKISKKDVKMSYDEFISSARKGVQFMPERPAEQERIVAATYTDPRTGEVREGVNHKAANPNAPDEQTDRESRYYGFKTDTGRVVNREEAYRIAEASGQLKEATSEEDKFNTDRGVLHSNMVDIKPTIGEKPQSSEMIGADTIKPADLQTSAKPESDELPKQASLAKGENFEVSKSGDVFVDDITKPVKFTKDIGLQFMPARPEVNLEDYIDKPIIALTADRMGIGKAYVGPKGAEQEVSQESQGGPGFSFLYTDEQSNPVWGFTRKEDADRFVGRVTSVAKKEKSDSVLVAPTLLSPDNHLHNPTGQLGYATAIDAAIKANMLDSKLADSHIEQIMQRIAAGKALPKADKDKFSSIKSLAEFTNAVKAKEINFRQAALIREKASAKTLPISVDDMTRMGILPSEVAKNLSQEGFYELPTFSVVSLFEVAANSKPEQGGYHYAYPWIVRGKAIGFLKNIYNLDKLTSETNVRSKTTGELSAQPVMVVMPQLDPQKIQEASNVLQNLNKPTK